MSVNFLLPELGDIKSTIKAQFKTNPNTKYFLWCVAKPQNFMEAFGLDIKQVSMLIMSFLGSTIKSCYFLMLFSRDMLVLTSRIKAEFDQCLVWTTRIFMTVDNFFYYRRRNTNSINLSRQI